ncbi:hypothetical protein DFP92_10264 [Yoonia sediminilitoris]|uniref:Uncharacterized protein n=1 Tax=Yoonia sediminilitoris TaxID=1286148 RepID=A0A2T6KLJ2_9RHOB|nr:hypothetical protein C8N45_10264 [Yoonia sediminilitoris]RCW97349.1 hypothetical protein DFP92_10264 [Yoonia sediminilitoris]
MGIVLTAAGGQAALLRLRNLRRKPKLLAATQSKTRLDHFDPVDPSRFAAVFRELVKDLPKVVRRADMPVFVSLPDPLVREDVLRFADFPDGVAEAQDLVRMRLLRETGGAMVDPVCTYEVIDRADEVTVRVRSLERALRDAIEQGASAAGLHITRLESWLGYASVALGDVAPDGACLFSDGDSWSLTCWAQSVPEGYFEAGWVADADDDLGNRIARLIQSFALAHDASPLTLVGAAPDALVARLPGDVVGAIRPGADVFAAAVTPAQGVAQWG